MFKGFVAVADRYGLVCFLPDKTTPWVVTGAPGGAFCFHAVLSDEAAEAVSDDLARGEHALALRILDTLAVELTPVTRASRPYEVCS